MLQLFRKSRFFVALAAILMISQVAAAESLVVTFNDDSTVRFDLNERPAVTFDESRMYVVGETVEADYSLEEVKKFTFSSLTDAIDPVVLGETRLTYLDSESVSVSGLGSGAEVSLYSLSGQKIAAAAADASGYVTFSLSACPRGVYFISITNGKSFKIIR